ncbi:Retrovirus-related Pol polyprotein from transposon [Dictyocoela muelleri]|nr:Retrovirus-related Pol polyprotein from transposon [Dictyocoela muelleri]
MYFRTIVYGREIFIFTDCRNITNLKDPDIRKRIEKWKVLISDFDCKFEYLTASENKAADCLSRQMLTIINDKNNDKLKIENWKLEIENSINLINESDSNDLNNKILELHHALGHPSYNKVVESFKINSKIKKLFKNVFDSCKDCEKIKHSHR